MTRQADLNSKLKRVIFNPKTIEDQKVSDDFKKLCIQDGLEVHDLMLEAFRLVFKVHHWPPGNPQLTLANCQQGKTLNLGKCGFINCAVKAVRVGVYSPSGKEYKLCMKHFNQAENDRANWEFKESLGRDGGYSR